MEAPGKKYQEETWGRCHTLDTRLGVTGTKETKQADTMRVGGPNTQKGT